MREEEIEAVLAAYLVALEAECRAALVIDDAARNILAAHARIGAALHHRPRAQPSAAFASQRSGMNQAPAAEGPILPGGLFEADHDILRVEARAAEPGH